MGPNLHSRRRHVAHSLPPPDPRVGGHPQERMRFYCCWRVSNELLSLKVLHCIFPVRTVKGLQGSRLLSRRLLSTQVTSLMFSKQDTPLRPPGLLVLLFLLSCPPATLLSLPSYFPSKLNLGVAFPRGHPVRAPSPLPGSPRAASARLARTRPPVSPARPCVSISVAPR